MPGALNLSCMLLLLLLLKRSSALRPGGDGLGQMEEDPLTD